MTFFEITYVPGTFGALERSAMKYGSTIPEPLRIPSPLGMLTISPDGQSFDLDLSGIDAAIARALSFTYRTTYVPGVALRNLIKMYSDRWSSDWVYRNATSGGGTSTIARIPRQGG